MPRRHRTLPRPRDRLLRQGRRGRRARHAAEACREGGGRFRPPLLLPRPVRSLRLLVRLSLPPAPDWTVPLLASTAIVPAQLGVAPQPGIVGRRRRQPRLRLRLRIRDRRRDAAPERLVREGPGQGVPRRQARAGLEARQPPSPSHLRPPVRLER